MHAGSAKRLTAVHCEDGDVAEFAVYCHKCGKEMRGPQCSWCKYPALQCCICHIGVRGGLLLFSVACLTFQQHASVSQGWICSDNCTCCHTEIEVADQTFYLIQSQCTDIRPTSPSADPVTPGAWQGSHWSAYS